MLDINLDYQYAMNAALHELALGDKVNMLTNLERRSAEEDLHILINFLRHLKIESPLDNLNEKRSVNGLQYSHHVNRVVFRHILKSICLRFFFD